MEETEASGPRAPSTPSGTQQSSVDEQQSVHQVLLAELAL